jgi:hypothetical protein
LIYEIRQSPTIRPGVFAPRGAGLRLWKTREAFETLLVGPAETGKTWSSIHYLDTLLWWFAGAHAFIARKTYNALIGSALRTYTRILGPGSPVKAFGGQRPQWFDYPNGSRCSIVGLDNPGKTLSAEYDFGFVNQAEEITLEDWETLSTRLTGRGAVAPFTRLFGDANPGPPTHWILHRKSLLRLESRHVDNPTLYTRDGLLTVQGRRSMTILYNLTGVRKQRLLFGRWVAAEGVVYDAWDGADRERGGNVVRSMPEGWTSWRKIRSIDFGYHNPFVCQWWAISPDGDMYLYRELYVTHRTVSKIVRGVPHPSKRGEWLARGIAFYSQGEKYEATVCDHDAEDRATLAEEGINTAPALKSVERGIKATADRIGRDDRGRRRLFVYVGAPVEPPDEWLLDNKQPTSTIQEFDLYVWPKGHDGKPVKDEPVKEYDHGMDAMRYAVAYVDLQGPVTVTSDEVIVINSAGEVERPHSIDWQRGYAQGGGGVEIIS